MLANPFQKFKTVVSGIALPEKFTFPFYYEPHRLSEIAARELQEYLEQQTDFEHNFGIHPDQKGLIIGKMFGVLVYQTQDGELGYLWAFSGKLAESNHHSRFVPPVFDMLTHNSFFKQEEKVLNALNRKIKELETSGAYLEARQALDKIRIDAEKDLLKQKQRIKELKIVRDQKRLEAEANLPFNDYKTLQKNLSEESKQESILLKNMTKYWNHQKAAASKVIQTLQGEINALKEERKQKSAVLQQQLFDSYSFLNHKGELKSIGELFDNNPPAGAGECAAPKLLHFAFKNGLIPIAMAEFWWGQSPKSEVRKHKHFYPACKSKCEPLLMTHMLDGLELEANPFQENPGQGIEIEIVYEDEVLLVINKPPEFLSVPGKIITDSVYSRVKEQFPEATGPLIVHRLDMSTSGLLVLAKNEETYVLLQRQFIQRTVKKRYVALLQGIIKQKEGIIDLPLRVDLDDRPRQLVCYEHGKPAQTRWEVIAVKNNQTRVYFYPITGRTHQLRVHAAHSSGLQTPIVGDDLYGKKANRLHLHAERLTFVHPVSKEEMMFTSAPPF
jgi:tRNA pseudouridine32 synthase/23S rRNA pseudouridine746 synthase